MISKFLPSILIVFVFAISLNAATYVVNSTSDESDANTGDSICETSNAGECTLRAAITESNLTAGIDSVVFNIPAAGVQTISPNSALPDIVQPISIDGYTQPGASFNTQTTINNATILIELSGLSAGAGANGLTLFASGSTIKGLAINRFNRVGISLPAGDNNIISGNFIGTDATGLIDLGNASVGIYGEFGSQSNGNTIGGTTLEARNIVSGNGNAGILFEFQGVNNIVQGNFVGLAADGTTILANNGFGIGFGSFTAGTIIGGDDDDDGAADGVVTARNYISGNTGSGIFIGNPATISGNLIGTDTSGTLARPNSVGIQANIGSNSLIGGTTAGAGNLISGNTGDGISAGNTGNLIIRGNRIGTSEDGISALANSGDGIEIASGGSNNQIGGITANDGNIIAFNGANGIQITDSGIPPVGNPILGNAIYSNGGLAVNLSVDAVTPNDPGDADTGANNLQNYPVIVDARPGSTRVIGNLNSTANTVFRLEFFNSPVADGSGNGEGQFFVGAVNVTTDGSGNASFDQTFGPNSPLNSFISATATNLTTLDTSEFSNAKQVLNPTAAAVSVGGRVSNQSGRGVYGVRISLMDADGNARYSITNPFGFYRFANVPAGATYVLTARHKGYEFEPRLIYVSEDFDEFNFFALSKMR